MTRIILLTGRAAPLPGSDQFSGIDKHPVDGPLALGSEGLAGDEQADHRVGPSYEGHRGLTLLAAPRCVDPQHRTLKG